MFNFINFLFGARATDEWASQTALEVIGLTLWERMGREHPELKTMTKENATRYLSNEWINEETVKTYQDRGEEIDKAQKQIAVILTKLL